MIMRSFLPWLFFECALGSLIPRDGQISYDGHRVYRVHAEGNTEAVLSQLAPLAYQEWCRSAQHVDISMTPENSLQFERLELDYAVLHDDLGADILAESTSSVSSLIVKRDNSSLPDEAWFDSYHSYADHIAYWKALHAAFKNNSEYFEIGNSYENRSIFGLKLHGSSNGTAKRSIVWHGTVHAREWITGMTVEYIAYNLIKSFQAGDTAILDAYDIYILPFVNPDGFVYTQTTDRLWRKNRSPGPNGTCYGTDINRNWPYQWIGDPRGSSPDPCAQTYRGEAPGDTPENQALVAHMLSLASPIAQYIDFHSYGQYILSPYGFNDTIFPPNSEEQIALGEAAAEAIRNVYGTKYTVGPSGSTLYPTTGSSNDYAMDVAGAEYSYAVELRDMGTNGFVLPPEQIRPAAEEMLAGILVMLTQM